MYVQIVKACAPLLSYQILSLVFSSDSRPFRLGGGANMDRVVRMDREMTKV